MLWIQDPRGATDPCPSRGAADVASGSSGSSSSPEAVWAMAYVCYPLQRAQSSFCFKQRYVVLILPSFYLLLQPAESLSSSTSKFAICAGACHYDSLPPPVTPGPLFGRFMHPRSLTSQPWTRWRTRCFSEPLRWCFSGPKRDPNGTKHTHTHLSSPRLGSGSDVQQSRAASRLLSCSFEPKAAPVCRPRPLKCSKFRVSGLVGRGALLQATRLAPKEWHTKANAKAGKLQPTGQVHRIQVERSVTPFWRPS